MYNNIDYEKKYLKYKSKYLDLQQKGGMEKVKEKVKIVLKKATDFKPTARSNLGSSSNPGQVDSDKQKHTGPGKMHAWGEPKPTASSSSNPGQVDSDKQKHTGINRNHVVNTLRESASKGTSEPSSVIVPMQSDTKQLEKSKEQQVEKATSSSDAKSKANENIYNQFKIYNKISDLSKEKIYNQFNIPHSIIEDEKDIQKQQSNVPDVVNKYDRKYLH